MEDAMTPERNDGTVAASPAAVAEAVPHDDDLSDDPRYQRIVDYLNTALAIQDPLASNVAAVNSDLMLMGYRLKQAIAAAMASASAVAERQAPAARTLSSTALRRASEGIGQGRPVGGYA